MVTQDGMSMYPPPPLPAPSPTEGQKKETKAVIEKPEPNTLMESMKQSLGITAGDFSIVYLLLFPPDCPYPVLSP